MIDLKIKIEDQEAQQAMRRLAGQGKSLKPAKQDIGEYLVGSVKRRFAEGKGPDGTPWEANKESTMLALLARRGGGTSRRKGEKSSNPYFRQDGRLSKRGGRQVSGKRPLIGESKRLSTEIHFRITDTGVEVGSPLEQSAVMQFGAKKGDFGRTKRGGEIPWGDIPARPFLGFSDEDKVNVLDILQEHLEMAMKG
ncbi:MAG: phage virion morphogenesis protein [Desulfobulbia bacterium]